MWQKKGIVSIKESDHININLQSLEYILDKESIKKSLNRICLLYDE